MNTNLFANTLTTLFGELVHGAPGNLQAEVTRWLDALRTPREVQEIELNGMIGSIARLAYHLGAIRQINSPLRGPAESAV
jgi:hypothetical protein